jgi:hypothetical protein
VSADTFLEGLENPRISGREVQAAAGPQSKLQALSKRNIVDFVCVIVLSVY